MGAERPSLDGSGPATVKRGQAREDAQRCRGRSGFTRPSNLEKGSDRARRHTRTDVRNPLGGGVTLGGWPVARQVDSMLSRPVVARYFGQGVYHCGRRVECSPRSVGNVKSSRIVTELELRGPGAVGDLLERCTSLLAGLESFDDQNRLRWEEASARMRACAFCGGSLDGRRRNISRSELKARRVDAVALLPIPAHHLDECTLDRRPGLRRYAVWEVELHCVLDEFRPSQSSGVRDLLQLFGAARALVLVCWSQRLDLVDQVHAGG